MLVSILTQAEFVVLQADSGRNALRIAAKYAGRIDLLLFCDPAGRSTPSTSRLLFGKARITRDVMLSF